MPGAALVPAPLDFARGHWAWGGRTYVMAILNATPDSFSGDGLLGSFRRPAY